MASTDNYSIYHPALNDNVDNLVPHLGMMAQSVDDALGVSAEDTLEYITSLFVSSAVSARRPSNWSIPGTDLVTIPFTTTTAVRGPRPPQLQSNALVVRDAGLYMASIRLVFGSISSGWRDAHILINGETSDHGAINSISDGASSRRIVVSLPIELQENDRVSLGTQGQTANSGQFLNSNNQLRLTRIAPINIGD